jgi:hypothetical protein
MRHSGPVSIPPSAPDAAPGVPGFELRRLLGRGAHAEVWLATDLGTADPVALKLRGGRPGGESSGAAGEAAAALAREVGLLQRIDHPNVVRLHRVVATSGGGLAMVLEFAPCGSLSGLVAERVRLDPPEVTTLLVPLGRALAHLHGRGLVHGDVAPGNVLFAADGRPMLSDLGAAGVLGRTGDGRWGTPGFTEPGLAGPADAASDVWSLGAVGWFALTGCPPGQPPQPETVPAHAPPDLVALLRACLDADRSARPDPTEVARRAWAAVPPVPLRLLPWVDAPDSAPAPSSSEVTRRIRAAAPALAPPASTGARRRGLLSRRGSPSRWERPAALAMAAVLVVVLGVVGLARIGRAGRPAVASPDLTSSVQELARRRALAFATTSTAPLSGVDEPGSPAMAADAGLVARLAARGLRLDGLRFSVSGVRVVERTSGQLSVAVVVTTSAHRQLRRDGTLAVRVPASPARAVRLILVPDRRGGQPRWLVRRVSRGP